MPTNSKLNANKTAAVTTVNRLLANVVSARNTLGPRIPHKLGIPDYTMEQK